MISAHLAPPPPRARGSALAAAAAASLSAAPPPPKQRGVILGATAFKAASAFVPQAGGAGPSPPPCVDAVFVDEASQMLAGVSAMAIDLLDPDRRARLPSLPPADTRTRAAWTGGAREAATRRLPLRCSSSERPGPSLSPSRDAATPRPPAQGPASAHRRPPPDGADRPGGVPGQPRLQVHPPAGAAPDTLSPPARPPTCLALTAQAVSAPCISPGPNRCGPPWTASPAARPSRPRAPRSSTRGSSSRTTACAGSSPRRPRRSTVRRALFCFAEGYHRGVASGAARVESRLN